MALDLQDATLAGITAFYAIVNIPKSSLLLIFQEMNRVLVPGGLLLLAFHAGDEARHEEELWGRSISMDFFLFQPSEIRQCLEAAGLVVEEIIERQPYAPEVEYQSRRAYIFARKPGRVSRAKETAARPEAGKGTAALLWSATSAPPVGGVVRVSMGTAAVLRGFLRKR